MTQMTRQRCAAPLRLQKGIEVTAEVGRAEDVLKAAVEKKSDVALTERARDVP